tara:strand:- start:443 stop:829 length:387 start_codon:yes stop_codon:yes gene_type:complete
MKKKLSIFGLVAVIAVSFSIVAKNLLVEEDDGYVSERERRMIKEFDQDGDGKLNRDERRAARVAKERAEAREKAEFLKRFDRDGDGKLSRDEKESAEKAMRERRKGKGDKQERIRDASSVKKRGEEKR